MDACAFCPSLEGCYERKDRRGVWRPCCYSCAVKHPAPPLEHEAAVEPPAPVEPQKPLNFLEVLD